jgi:hypothetical protein
MTLLKKRPNSDDQADLQDQLQKAVKEYKRLLGTRKEILIRKAAKN